MKILQGLLALLMVPVLLAGCSKSDNPKTEELTEEERLILKANKFVYDYTSEAYLWSGNIPEGIGYASAPTPQELFELMRYKELDKWSYVTDNSQEAMDEFQGVSTTYGYSLAFGKFSNSPDNLFAVVQYVYAGSPAMKAGLKRGDIILTYNGADLTVDNYRNLYYSQSMEIGMGTLTDGGSIGYSGVSHKLDAIKMYEDPVVSHSVIDAGGKKVGYLFYAGYYAESHEKLAEVFKGFQSAGVSELILDLRYNLGGNAVTPPYLASLFAPVSAVNGKKVFLTETWNDLYMEYYRQMKHDMNVYFNEDTPVNLNLDRVFILTTSSTASASEATISGLMPYMDVVRIGEKTYGKYCAAALLSPKDADGNTIEEISNWLLTLVVYKFVNTQGFTEFKDGIEPTFEVSDSGLLQGIPLGDERDPMIAKAISIITGGTKAAAEYPVQVQGIQMLPYMGERPMREGMNIILTNK